MVQYHLVTVSYYFQRKNDSRCISIISLVQICFSVPTLCDDIWTMNISLLTRHAMQI